MIKIIIEGPKGSGKTTLAHSIRCMCLALGKQTMIKEEMTAPAIQQAKPAILIITKVSN